MMMKDDLSLSLSLGSAWEKARRLATPLQLNLTPSPQAFVAQKAPAVSALWNDLLSTSSSAGGGGARLFLKGLDVNRVPAADRVLPDEEDEAGTSSPGSTVSSVVSGGAGGGVVGGKIGSDRGDDHDLHPHHHHHHPAHHLNSGSIGDDIELAMTGSRSISDEEDGGEGSRKKLRLSKEQSAVLEESFKEHNTLNPKHKLILAQQLNLRPRQVEVWFQNRRARTKLKQTEVDCEFLKRCCETLTEENRRLQKEVQELRALKLSPQLYMHMTPPTTLTMCPSCERVAVSPGGGAASNSNVNHTATSSTADNRARPHLRQPFPLQNHHHHHPPSPSPRAPVPEQRRRPFPVASAGVYGAGYSLHWAPAPLRAAAAVDASDPRS